MASLALDKSRLGKELRQLRKEGVRVSVFVDDILLSHDGDKLRLEEASDRVLEAAQTAHFLIPDTKIQRPGSCITAFNIAVNSGSMNITSERIGRFLDQLAFSRGSPRERAIIGYVASVNATQAAELAE